MYLFLALLLLLNGERASLEESSRVLGLLSRKPLTPPSHRKPSILSVHILPPAFFSDSRTMISKEGLCSRRKYARERPEIPPPMITNLILFKIHPARHLNFLIPLRNLKEAVRLRTNLYILVFLTP